jgi:hypothetical protein
MFFFKINMITKIIYTIYIYTPHFGSAHIYIPCISYISCFFSGFGCPALAELRCLLPVFALGRAQEGPFYGDATG